MGKAEDKAREEAIAEIEAKFAEPEYHGEKLFNLVGVICAGITIAVAVMQFFDIVSTGWEQFKLVASNPQTSINSIAPFFWCLCTM
jgi:hypothetical protein